MLMLIQWSCCLKFFVFVIIFKNRCTNAKTVHVTVHVTCYNMLIQKVTNKVTIFMTFYIGATTNINLVSPPVNNCSFLWVFQWKPPKPYLISAVSCIISKFTYRYNNSERLFNISQNMTEFPQIILFVINPERTHFSSLSETFTAEKD